MVERGFHDNPLIRRRTAVISGLFAVVILLRLWLRAVPRQVERLATLPGTDQVVPTLVTNPLYETLSVASLILGLLAVLLLASLLLVDYFLVHQMEVDVPNILRAVGIATLLFPGALLILYYETDLDVTGLFTTSAVLSVVIGLALQDTLGNLFSGLALQTERSFAVGDWVRFSGYEGEVRDISWRATRLRTRDNDLVVIPNSVIGKDVVVNYSAPTRVHSITTQVGTHYRHPPARVIEALQEAVRDTDTILKVPRPLVHVVAFGESEVTYEVRYWIRDFATRPEVASALRTRIWYVFKRRGIEIPFPIRTVQMQEAGRADENPVESETETLAERLARVPSLGHLAGDALLALAERARREQYFSGETVVRQGEPGETLYVIDNGAVEVLLSEGTSRERIAELGPGDYVGEMSLLTGEPRSATVRALEPTQFIVVDRTAFRAALDGNAEIMRDISQTLARRREELEYARSALHTDAPDPAAAEQQILSRIRQIFRL